MYDPLTQIPLVVILLQQARRSAKRKGRSDASSLQGAQQGQRR